ncbi:hypothetical protein BOTBODRAFT_52729 [Botryobasidium botryosum FD-172 SS1]|uniref:Major facilitator superfamily (MFS) profile domain-containing protein n=1 Tax=Botryobasidium botryosum (strain FD-172 SS1) TaxID=930990 RepID=A0A067MT81_BOTB1|nr:hypothetical protein BOTBODRAFT_52729 [Botryobasidium botryosum FD-172 SS1]
MAATVPSEAESVKSHAPDCDPPTPYLNYHPENTVVDASTKSAESNLSLPLEPPNGGARAWTVVFGAWLILFAQLGLSNSFGTFQQYFEHNILSDHSASAISWIGAIQIFFQLFCGIFCGRIFDAYGSRWLLLTGSGLFVASLIIVSFCKLYYQFILAEGVLLGIACAMLYHPAVTVTTQYFTTRKAFSVGIIMSGAGIGGMVWPVFLSALFHRIGFGWTMRASAFFCLALFAVANACITSFLPPRKPSPIKDTFEGLHDRNYVFLTLGTWFFFLGFYLPCFYLPVFAQSVGLRGSLPSDCLTIMNATGIVGRLAISFVSDKVGRFNAVAASTFLSGTFVLGLWIPSRSPALVIVFSAVYGFWSGACLALFPACSGQISRPERAGNRLGVIWAFVSFAALASGPVGGAIISHFGDTAGPSSYTWMIFVCGASMIISSGFLLAGKLACNKNIFAVV